MSDDGAMTAVPFAEFLADRVVLLDGGLATQLERRGNDLSDPLWSARLLVEAPDEIVEAHLAYFRAGARVATTASYQASFEGFARRGIDRAEAARLLELSVELATEARRRFEREAAASGRPVGPRFVVASIGPYGAAQADGSEYRGDYGLSVADLRAWHAPRLAILAAAGPDALAFETLPTVGRGSGSGRPPRRDGRAAGLAQLQLRRWVTDAPWRARRGRLPSRRRDGPDRRGRVELHVAAARRRAHRPSPVGHGQADRGLSEQRRGLGPGRPALDRRGRAGRRRRRRPDLGRGRREPHRRLLPGRSGPDRELAALDGVRRAASGPRDG